MINIYNPQLQRVGMIASWVSLIWETRYNELGSFLIETQKVNGMFELLSLGNYCTLQGERGLMIITSRRTEGKRIIATGYPASWILSRRASTMVIRPQNAEAAMRSVVSNMEPWDGLRLADVSGIPDMYQHQISDGTVYKYVQDIAVSCDIGFRIVKSGNSLLFEAYKPQKNPNAKYSELYGNLGNYTYTETDANYANVAIVAGAESGDERITVTAGATGSTGHQRREIYLDARHIQPKDEESLDDYKGRLIEYGESKLIDYAFANGVSIDIKDKNVLLGDLIYVKLKEIGIVATVRITRYTIKSQNNEITRTVGTGVSVIQRRAK